MKNAVIFTRVSSERQEEGHSLNAQLKRLQEYCEKRDLKVIKEFEVSESSTIGDRKQFHEMIDFVKDNHRKGKSQIALIVDAVDRLQRGFKECPLIDDLIQKDIIEVHFYKESFILNKNSSSTDILRWDMAVLFAKSYVSALSDNVKRGNKYAWEKGLWTGKPPQLVTKKHYLIMESILLLLTRVKFII
jgi:DNA invertase Pin-like site-specific DNA recombinase